MLEFLSGVTAPMREDWDIHSTWSNGRHNAVEARCNFPVRMQDGCFEIDQSAKPIPCILVSLTRPVAGRMQGTVKWFRADSRHLTSRECIARFPRVLRCARERLPMSSYAIVTHSKKKSGSARPIRYSGRPGGSMRSTVRGPNWRPPSVSRENAPGSVVLHPNILGTIWRRRHTN